MVIYYLFPALSRWNSSVIKLFVHPCIRAHINIYFNYEDIIYIVCFLSARPFALRFHLKWAKRFKDGTCFVFIVFLPPFISLNAASFQRGRGTVVHGKQRGSAALPRAKNARPLGHLRRGREETTGKERAEEAGGGKRRRLALYNYTLKMAYLPPLPARSCLLSW